MKLYILKCSEIYDGYNLSNEIDTLELSEIFDDCTLLNNDWQKCELDIIESGKHGDLAFCFSISDSGLLISENARHKLKDVFTEENVEFLETYYKDEQYYLVHAMVVENFCMEWEYTILGYQFKINNEDLYKRHIEDKYFFRAKHNKLEMNSTVIYTEKFINKLKELGLKGVEFTEIWDTEK